MPVKGQRGAGSHERAYERNGVTVTMSVTPDKAFISEFIGLPWRLYKDDALWVPPLKARMANILRGKDNVRTAAWPHAFLMARTGKGACGRLMVGIDERLNAAKGKTEGYISLFESTNDGEVASSLLSVAAEWLHERGMTTVVGPLSPTGGDDGRGVLIQGFDSPPVMLNNHNPPYYAELLEASGFEKYMDLLAFRLDPSVIDVDRYKKVVEYAMARYRFTIERFDLRRFDRECQDIKAILDAAMPQSWEHLTPPTLEEVRKEARAFKDVMDPDLVYIARAGDEPIGLVVALPDFNPVLKAINGTLSPLGVIRMFSARRHIRGARVMMQFVVPKYRNKAVSGAIYLRLMLTAARKGYTYGEGSTIAEMNRESVQSVERAGGVLYKTYRLYRKDI